MPFLLEEAFPPQGFCRHPQLITVLGARVRAMGKKCWNSAERSRAPGQGEAQTSLMGDLTLSFQKAWKALASLRHLFIYKSTPCTCFVLILALS